MMPVLSSAGVGFGISSLWSDMEELSAVVTKLRPHFKKMVLLGHSTGAQGVVFSLKHGGVRAGGASIPSNEPLIFPNSSISSFVPPRVDGVILHSAISDREAITRCAGSQNKEQTMTRNSRDIESLNSEDLQNLINHCETLVNSWRGEWLLGGLEPVLEASRGESDIRSPPPLSPRFGVGGRFFKAPMTAYRLWSLFARGGDDDLFSTDLSQAEMNRNFAALQCPVLAIYGEQDEFLRPQVFETCTKSCYGAKSCDGVHRLRASMAPTADTNVREGHGGGSMYDALWRATGGLFEVCFLSGNHGFENEDHYIPMIASKMLPFFNGLMATD